MQDSDVPAMIDAGEHADMAADAVQFLEELNDLLLIEHVSRYEALHGQLQSALASIDKV